MRLIDCAARKIAPGEIKSAGYDGAVAYVSESRPGTNFEAKPITREYADALRAQGLHIVSNFQYGKPGGTAPSDFTRGFDGGIQDARTALRLHEAAGGPDSAPILFSVDDDIDLGTWNSVDYRAEYATWRAEIDGVPKSEWVDRLWSTRTIRAMRQFCSGETDNQSLWGAAWPHQLSIQLAHGRRHAAVSDQS